MKQPAPNDHFFKALVSHSEAAEDLIRCFLPPGFPAPRPGSVKLASGSYVSEDLRESFSDALFACEFDEQPGAVHCLIEHQTTVPRLMVLRTAGYAVKISEDWAKANPGAETLPVVISIVIYQGTRKWSAPTRMLDLAGLRPERQEQLRDISLSGGYLLANLRELDLSRFRCGLLLRLGLGLMKAVIDDRQIEWLERCGEDLSDLLTRPDGGTILRLMLNYISCTEPLHRKPSTLREIANKVANEKVKREIMTIAEATKEEGRVEGRVEGRMEGIEEGLTKGILIGEIQACQRFLRLQQDTAADLRAFSVEELEQKLRVLRAEK